MEVQYELIMRQQPRAAVVTSRRGGAHAWYHLSLTPVSDLHEMDRLHTRSTSPADYRTTASLHHRPGPVFDPTDACDHGGNNTTRLS